MQCYVYCLYSTADGVPRYVGKASDKVSYRFRKHVAAALDMEEGAVYDWIRQLWKQDHDVAVHTLQEGIMPRDLDLFEQYWIDQFAELVNKRGNRPDKTNSRIADQITKGIQQQLTASKERSGDITPSE